MTELQSWLEAGARFALIVVMLKAGLLTGSALVVGRLMRDASAATRHGLWVVTFAALSALPIATLFPRIAVDVPEPASAVFERAPARSSAVRPAPVGEFTSTGRPAVVADHSSLHGHGEIGYGPARAGSARAVALDAVSTMPNVALSWWAVAGLVYVTGCAFLLLRMAVHFLIACGIARRAMPPEGWLRGMMDDQQGWGWGWGWGWGLHARTRVLVSDEVSVPIMFGVLNPVIVLPAEAVGWPRERIRVALLHEGAHIERRDAVVQRLVRVVCALYWPNPLVRMAAARQQSEQEQACDDRAILAGIDSHAYAHHLLDIARDAIAHRRLAGALAIAGGGLRDRILAVLDPHTNHLPASRCRLAVAALLLGALVLPLAAIELRARSTPPAPPQGPADADMRALAAADPAVRARAAWSLGERELQAAVQPLIVGLRDGDPLVRTIAAWALGEIRHARAGPALLDALDRDPDPLVRELAALALGELRDPAAVERMSAAFERVDAPHTALAWALRRTAPRTADGRSIRQLTAGTAPWLDLDQDRAFPWRGQPDLQPADAVLLLASPDAPSRARAAWSLGVAGDSVAIGPLIDRIRDPDPIVRATVVWALDEINPTRPNRD